MSFVQLFKLVIILTQPSAIFKLGYYLHKILCFVATSQKWSSIIDILYVVERHFKIADETYSYMYHCCSVLGVNLK
jgi:hypothetical protein